ADLDGEVSELHLAGENFAQRMSAAFRTAYRDLASGNEERGEEGKALDVSPVRVAEQDRCRDGLRCVRHELRAERASARPAVKYETGAPARRHSHTRGVAAETDGARAWRGDRPPGAPESYLHTPPPVSAIRTPRGDRRGTGRAPRPARESPRAHGVRPPALGMLRSPKSGSSRSRRLIPSCCGPGCERFRNPRVRALQRSPRRPSAGSPGSREPAPRDASPPGRGHVPWCALRWRAGASLCGWGWWGGPRSPHRG